jgi:ankyrin repeat protein
MERLHGFVKLWRDTAEGDDMVVRALCEQRDPDTGRTALHFAARGAQEAAAALLLDLGADPNR